MRAPPYLDLLGVHVEDENHALHLGEDVLLVQEVVLPEHILTVRGVSVYAVRAVAYPPQSQRLRLKSSRN